MKWRLALALAVALALPVPLLWLARLAVRPEPPSESGLVPMLGKTERWKHPSFKQPCTRSADCLPPLVCTERAVSGLGQCLDSECRTDMDCGEGFHCRVLPSMGQGPLIRSCDILNGERSEGEPCAASLGARSRTCKQGLRCNDGWCGRPCQGEGASDCPEGFFCREGLNGPSCVPSCEGRACAEGLRCIRQAGGVSVCAQLEGEDCWRSPCPEGLVCATLDARVRPGGVRVSAECVRACAPGQPPCPTGFRCLAEHCRRTCDVQAPSGCQQGEECIHWVDLGTGLCRPR